MASARSSPTLAPAAPVARLPVARLPKASARNVSAAAAPREVISAKEASDCLSQGYRCIDVRNPDEFGAGHISGATNIPVKSETFVQQVEEAIPDKNTPLMVHCQKGGRATTAANQLADKYPNLVNFKGSMDAWLAENMPVEK